MTEETENLEKENKGNLTEKLRENPWIVSTVIFAIASIVLLILTLSPGITGNAVAGGDAGTNLVDYLNSKVGGGVEYVSYEDLGNIYQVTVKYNGDDIPVYITKDGKYFVQGATLITGKATQTDTTQTQQTEVPKSDKPVAEAFIFSYCPYGLQFEKALIPVYNILKDKADIKIVAIGAMHGEYEKIESLRQISIEQLYGTDKLFAYLGEFDNNVNIGTCGGDSACLDKYLPAIYTKLGIDKTKVNNYMETNALKIYNEQNARASSLGVSGSPTFVINDVNVAVSRTPEAIKEAICSAFNTEPEECSQTLSSDSTSPGFGSSTSSSGSAASCG